MYLIILMMKQYIKTIRDTVSEQYNKYSTLDGYYTSYDIVSKYSSILDELLLSKYTDDTITCMKVIVGMYILDIDYSKHVVSIIRCMSTSNYEVKTISYYLLHAYYTIHTSDELLILSLSSTYKDYSGLRSYIKSISVRYISSIPTYMLTYASDMIYKGTKDKSLHVRRVSTSSIHKILMNIEYSIQEYTCIDEVYTSMYSYLQVLDKNIYDNILNSSYCIVVYYQVCNVLNRLKYMSVDTSKYVDIDILQFIHVHYRRIVPMIKYMDVYIQGLVIDIIHRYMIKYLIHVVDVSNSKDIQLLVDELHTLTYIHDVYTSICILKVYNTYSIDLLVSNIHILFRYICNDVLTNKYYSLKYMYTVCTYIYDTYTSDTCNSNSKDIYYRLCKVLTRYINILIPLHTDNVRVTYYKIKILGIVCNSSNYTCIVDYLTSTCIDIHTSYSIKQLVTTTLIHILSTIHIHVHIDILYTYTYTCIYLYTITDVYRLHEYLATVDISKVLDDSTCIDIHFKVLHKYSSIVPYTVYNHIVDNIYMYIQYKYILTVVYSICKYIDNKYILYTSIYDKYLLYSTTIHIPVSTTTDIHNIDSISNICSKYLDNYIHMPTDVVIDDTDAYRCMSTNVYTDVRHDIGVQGDKEIQEHTGVQQDTGVQQGEIQEEQVEEKNTQEEIIKEELDTFFSE